MADDDRIRQATRFLLDEHGARRLFTPLPLACAPGTLEEAYAVQDALATLRAATAGPPAGFKIALTSAVTRKMVGFNEPVSGILAARTIHQSPCIVRRAEYVRLGFECEIAVRLRSALPVDKAPYHRDAVADAVGAVMPAFELVDDRNANYAQLGANVLSLVADNVWNAGVVLGRPLTDWRAIDLAAVRATMSVNGQVVGEGYGRDVMGHPLDALTWLANMRAKRGQALPPGVVVITGSIVAPQFVDAGDRVQAALEGLGELDVTIA